MYFVNSESSSIEENFWRKPTLLWLTPKLGLDTQTGMELLCLLGMLLSMLAMSFRSWRDSITFFVLWFLYYSLYQVKTHSFKNLQVSDDCMQYTSQSVFVAQVPIFLLLKLQTLFIQYTYYCILYTIIYFNHYPSLYINKQTKISLGTSLIQKRICLIIQDNLIVNFVRFFEIIIQPTTSTLARRGIQILNFISHILKTIILIQQPYISMYDQRILRRMSHILNVKPNFIFRWDKHSFISNGKIILSNR